MSTNGTTAVAAATGGKRPSTNIGEPLSEESLRLVREVRRQLTVPLHSNVGLMGRWHIFVCQNQKSLCFV
jgi:hypothetical protein